MAEFRSELSVPINKDKLSFEERQKTIMSDIEREMEERRRQWESEVERTRREFFKTPTFMEAHVDNPSIRIANRTNFPTGSINDDTQTWYEDGPNGQPLWKARFSLTDFILEDIKVIVNPDRTLVVHAKAEKRDSGSVVSKEFSRQLTLPREVDIEKMASLLSSDGVLTVEAPVTSPDYGSLQYSNEQPSLLPGSLPRHGIQVPSVPPFQTTRFDCELPARSSSPRFQVTQTSCPSPRPATSVTSLPPAVAAANSLFTTPSRGIVAVNANGDQVMQWSFNLESNTYSAEEISVKVRNNSKLSVSAVHEERIGGRTSRHEFTRECDLPEIVDIRTLTTFYRPEQGILNIEAKLLPDYQTAIDQRNRGQRLPVAFE